MSTRQLTLVLQNNYAKVVAPGPLHAPREVLLRTVDDKWEGLGCALHGSLDIT